MTELYRHFGKDGQLLYVGISDCSVRRLARHRGGSYWFDEIVRIEIERFPSREEAHQAELAAIDREKPIHNLWTASKTGALSRKPDIEEERRQILEEAKREGYRMSKVWCLGVLKQAMARAKRGEEYPYSVI